MEADLDLPGRPRSGRRGLDRGQRIVMAGLVSNVVLASSQLFAGWYGGSQGVLADGIHSSSDILIGVMVFVSLGVARRPADESHPFGHGKAESIAAFLVGLMIAAAGLGLVYDAIQTLAGAQSRIPSVLPLIVAVGSILVKAFLYRITIRIGRELDSPGVLAAALEYRSCIASSSSALAGILGAWMGVSVADPVAALLVAGFILKSAGETLRDATRDLMDAALPVEHVREVRAASQEVDGVKEVSAVRTRRMGSKRQIELDIRVEPDLSVEAADQIAAQVKQRVADLPNAGDEVRVYLAPSELEAGRRREMEAVIRRILQENAHRFVAFRGLRITRLGGDLCADFTLVLPNARSVEESYGLYADLELEIKARYPDVEIVIRLQTEQPEP